MFNPFSLEKKIILVTGASSGIGKETAITLSKMGAQLILVGRNQEKLNETYKLLNGDRNHLVEVFDFNNTEKISLWLKEVVSRIETPIDGFVHCAGVFGFSPIRMINEELISRIMNLNFNSGLLLLKACSNRKVANNGSSFTFISSVAVNGEPGNIIYAASKGALHPMIKTAALEFASRNIRVNGVLPGLVRTVMEMSLSSQISNDAYESLVNNHPLGIGNPEDVANAIAYLQSDASKWVTGSILTVDGGYSCH